MRFEALTPPCPEPGSRRVLGVRGYGAGSPRYAVRNASPSGNRSNIGPVCAVPRIIVRSRLDDGDNAETEPSGHVDIERNGLAQPQDLIAHGRAVDDRLEPHPRGRRRVVAEAHDAGSRSVRRNAKPRKRAMSSLRRLSIGPTSRLYDTR